MSTFYTKKEQIISWLDKYKISNYELITDDKYGFVVNVLGDVRLSYKKLESIPVKFNIISGSFSFFYNSIKSLEFSPIEVTHSFLCSHNELTNLDFCPKIVGKNFDCRKNNLSSLEILPLHVGGNFLCGNNPKLNNFQDITNFEEIQQYVKANNLHNKLNKNLKCDFNLNNIKKNKI